MNSRRKFATLAILLVLLLGFSAQESKASPIGVVVTCSVGSILLSCVAINNGVTLGTVIDPGAEFTFDFFSEPQFDVDITSTSVILTMLSFETFQDHPFTLTLSGIAWLNDPNAIITGISNFSTNWNFPIASSAVTFSDHSVSIAFPSSGVWGGNTGLTLSFDFVTNHTVPEPASALLLVVGLGSLGFIRRRFA